MPFKSQSQRRFMFSQHPSIAKKWQGEFHQKKLPETIGEPTPPPDHMALPDFKKRVRANFGTLTSYLDKK